jgi:electron transfer flavoprotein beta subunit
MRAVVLLSAGCHPVSGRPAPVPVEAQAIRLARTLGAEVTGLHAGQMHQGLTEYLGSGLAEIELLEQPVDTDPLPSLASFITASLPHLVLAGRRGQGGTDSGLLPYRLANTLGWSIVADAVALARNDAELTVEQARPRGGRRRIGVQLPCVVTVHPAAPPPLPFAFAAAREGRISRVSLGIVPEPVPSPDERPYRRRPRLIGGSHGGSAAERLKAATDATAGGGKVLLNPAPEVAAAEILTFLQEIGVLGASPLSEQQDSPFQH